MYTSSLLFLPFFLFSILHSLIPCFCLTLFPRYTLTDTLNSFFNWLMCTSISFLEYMSYHYHSFFKNYHLTHTQHPKKFTWLLFFIIIYILKILYSCRVSLCFPEINLVNEWVIIAETKASTVIMYVCFVYVRLKVDSLRSQINATAISLWYYNN